MLPQLIVFGLAIVLLLGDAFLPKKWQYNGLTTISLAGYAAAMAALYWQDGKNEYTFNGMFHADGLTVFLSVILLATAILSVMVSGECRSASSTCCWRFPRSGRCSFPPQAIS
jgi:NADH-quinone oxidoreductase subunit N